MTILKLRLPQQHVRTVGADGDLDLVFALERDAVAARQSRLGDIGLALQHESIEAVRLRGTIDMASVLIAQQPRDLKSLADRQRPWLVAHQAGDAAGAGLR